MQGRKSGDIKLMQDDGHLTTMWMLKNDKSVTRCLQLSSRGAKAWKTRYYRCLIHHMSENMDQWTMAKELDTATDYSSSEKRQHTTLSELQNDQPD